MDRDLFEIYCAEEQATTELTSASRHRQPALELVREIVDEGQAV